MPPGKRVLEVGCGTGDILHSLAPEYGLGIDISPQMVSRAQDKYPALRFKVHDILGEPLNETFDFVVAVDVAEHVSDLGRAIKFMARSLQPDARLVITTVSPAWGPLLELAERLKLKMPEGDHQWRSRDELGAAASAAGLTEDSYDRFLLVPKAVPLVKRLNRASRTSWLRQRYGMIQRMVLKS